MNILVIGNGFDLAHGLPTKYGDFLEFTKVYKEKKDLFVPGQSIKEEWEKANDEEKKYIEFWGNLCDQKTKLFTELAGFILDNVWIEYFLSIYKDRESAGKDSWIDFESEISRVIQSLDNDMHGLSGNYSIDDDIENLSNDFLYKKYSVDTGEVLNHIEEITYKELRNKLLNDLNRLIRAFEIYLTDYVERIECQLVSPDIQKILPKESMKINGVPVYDVCVLSFNYTNTYQRLYIDKAYKHTYVERNIDYIHGKADINNTIESNNMVLGIDEYLSSDRKNTDIEFIAFKKYYQRIYKGTGCKYKSWVDNMWEERKAYELRGNRYPLQIPFNQFPEEHRHYAYFFGHSLDITDKDVLRELILNDNVYTTIFYHNKDTMGQQIANLVKVIGQDELIRRTGGNTKTIEFKLQQPMVSID